VACFQDLGNDKSAATLLSLEMGNRRRVEGKLPKGLPGASCVLGGDFPSRHDAFGRGMVTAFLY